MDEVVRRHRVMLAVVGVLALAVVAGAVALSREFTETEGSSAGTRVLIGRIVAGGPVGSH